MAGGGAVDPRGSCPRRARSRALHARCEPPEYPGGSAARAARHRVVGGFRRIRRTVGELAVGPHACIEATASASARAPRRASTRDLARQSRAFTFDPNGCRPRSTRHAARVARFMRTGGACQCASYPPCLPQAPCHRRTKPATSAAATSSARCARPRSARLATWRPARRTEARPAARSGGEGVRDFAPRRRPGSFSCTTTARCA